MNSPLENNFTYKGWEGLGSNNKTKRTHLQNEMFPLNAGSVQL